MKEVKIYIVFSILLLLVATAPAFAEDNNTAITCENESILQSDIYFDINVDDDGNGSADNPYKYLDSFNIVDDSTVHLAKGEYTLKGSQVYDNLTIIGQNPQNTIIKYYDSVGFTSNGLITLKNVKLLNLRINLNQNSNLTASNVIVDSSSGVNSAIYSAKGGNTVIFDNCTFVNNSAKYGGAIKLSGSVLNITHSIFKDNHATYYGGAIACDNSEIHITDCDFYDNYAINDAGGAIYLKESSLKANNLEFNNCSALFGGALTSLSSELNLTNCLAKNNRAKYYGGAIFKMYSSFELDNSIFESNSAFNGGALYVDNVADFKINSNYFSNNKANSTGGAVYSILSDSYYHITDKQLKNTFKNNNAPVNGDVYQTNDVETVFKDSDYILMNYNPYFNGTIPDKYDLRNYGFVTPVRSQGNGGNCWAFAASAALESAILKANNLTYDFSEENMKNIASKYSVYGWSMDTNAGGYDKMAIGYLASWLGPVNESDDDYSDVSVLSPLLNTSVHVQNVLFLTRNNFTDNDAIKKAVMDYGAVSTSIYWSSSYIKNIKNYYYTGTAGANHAVAIVGWDDNYKASNFKTAPEGDGAWIIKNSWGTSSGDKGYFYVSYYDTKIAQPGRYVSYAFVLNDTIRYDKNYQYDIAGRTDYFFNESGTVWYKNRFTATDNEYLSAVSTYFDQNTNWTLSVFVNNALKLTQSGFANPSYKTIDLNSLIPLKVGDVFEIVFKITVAKEAGVPISESVSLNTEIYDYDKSFISYDGKNWVDFYDLIWNYPDHTYNSQVACIKAFTVLNKINTQIALEVSNEYNPAEITAKVFTEYGSLVKSGKVTFNVEGKNIDVNVVDGVAKLIYAFKNTGKNSIKASFTGTGFNGASSNIVVTPVQTVISANDLNAYFGTFTYSVKLTDENNKIISNKELKFTVNNKNYVAKTDKNGIASVKLNLAVGSHNIEIGFNDLSSNSNSNVQKTITVKTTISFPTVTKYTYNATYSSKLIDSNAKQLANKNVSFTINDEKFTGVTDSNGNLKYNVNLTPGSYIFTVTNPLTGEVKSQTIKIVKRIDSNKDLTMYYGAGSSYKVRVYDNNGNIAKGVAVTFKINNKAYTRVTDSNGYASIKISLNPSTYTITAIYKGFKVSNKVVVKPTLILSTKTVKKSKTFTYKVKLLNSKGKILKNKKVTVKFRGKTYKVKTNSKGIATFKIKSLSKVGKFTLTASYGNAKISKKITVKK